MYCDPDRCASSWVDKMTAIAFSLPPLFFFFPPSLFPRPPPSPPMTLTPPVHPSDTEFCSDPGTLGFVDGSDADYLSDVDIPDMDLTMNLPAATTGPGAHFQNTGTAFPPSQPVCLLLPLWYQSRLSEALWHASAWGLHTHVYIRPCLDVHP